jgi:hypothetical protein
MGKEQSAVATESLIRAQLRHTRGKKEEKKKTFSVRVSTVPDRTNSPDDGAATANLRERKTGGSLRFIADFGLS